MVENIVTEAPQGVVERVSSPVASRIVEVVSPPPNPYLRRSELDAPAGVASTNALAQERDARVAEDLALRTVLDDMERISYVHNQGVPSDSWTIVHGLGFNPNVVIIDSAGSRVQGEDILYEDVNTLTLHFAIPFGGIAYLS